MWSVARSVRGSVLRRAALRLPYLHIPRTGDYHCDRMTRGSQRLLRSSIAILVLFSMAFVLVHWHEEKPGQDCGLCYAHQMPGLQDAKAPLLAGPGAYEWRSAASEQVLVSHAFVPSHPGRAPPLSLSLIFG